MSAPLPRIATRTLASMRFGVWTILAVIVAIAALPLVAQEAAPQITTDPSDQTVDAGARASFVAQVAGDSGAVLQWYFNGVPLPGQNFSALNIYNAQAANRGFYWLSASNVHGLVFSRIAQLNVTDASPLITAPPSVRAERQSTFFKPEQELIVVQETRGGSEPMARQWYFEGQPLAGATNAILHIASLEKENGGHYFMTASNAFGNAVGKKILIHVSSLEGLTQSVFRENQPAQLGRIRLLGSAYREILAVAESGALTNWSTLGVGEGAQAIPASAVDVVQLASGMFHTAALRSDGRVVVWPTNSIYRYEKIPDGATNLVSIAAGGYSTIAVRADGAALGWGSTTGLLPNPRTATNLVSVVAGPNAAAGVRADGGVVSWGGSAYTWVPDGMEHVIALSAASRHFLAMTEDGRVRAWGAPFAETLTNVPVNATNVVAIQAGDQRNVALRGDGSVVVWPDFQLPRTLTNVTLVAMDAFGPLFSVGDGSPFVTLHPSSRTLPAGGALDLHVRASGRQPMRYQWFRNGIAVVGATNASLTVDESQSARAGAYFATAANDLGTATSRVAQVSVAVGGTLGSALDAPDRNWSSFSSYSGALWFAQNGETFDMEDAAQSGAILDNRYSTLRTTVTGPGTVSFRWKVSSEPGYDWLKFTIVQTGENRRISGESDWEEVSVALTNGANLLEWTYSKDGSGAGGQDAGWVDTVSFAPTRPGIVTQPPSIVTYPGRTEFLRVVASSMIEPRYQWYLNGEPIPGANLPVSTFVTPASPSTNLYHVEVSNAVGTNSSARAEFIIKTPPVLGVTAKPGDGALRFRMSWRDGAAMTQTEANRFLLETSTNLVDWTPFPVVGIPVDGILDFVDSPETNRPFRFYRPAR